MTLTTAADAGVWYDVADTSVTFTVDRAATIFATYSINVQPAGNAGTNYLATRLVVDGTPYRESASHYQPLTTGDSNLNLNGNLVLDLALGSHTVKMQWWGSNTAGPGKVPIQWDNQPVSWGDIGGRTLVVMGFYK